MVKALRAIGVALVVCFTDCRGVRAAESSVVSAEDAWPALRDKTFEFVWSTVNDSYSDPTFNGVDWLAVKKKYAVLLPDASDKQALRGLLQSMLLELHKSHFAILPRELAVYTPQERVQMGDAGFDAADVGGEVVVTAVAPKSAAEQAGIRPGDAITQIQQQSIETLKSALLNAHYTPEHCGTYLAQFTRSYLRGKVGATLSLTVAGLDGKARTHEIPYEVYVGEWSEPVGDFPSMPVKCESKCSADGIAYLHFNIFARAPMKQIKATLRAIPATGGLVLDLRGNSGGIAIMASGITGWLSDHEFLLGSMHLRAGHLDFSVYPQANAFLGPVAILIDGGSASTSEILAAGLQETGRARIFGEMSAGAALPSSFKTLPTGDVLQYVIADLQTAGGVMLEGRGVMPDQKVGCTRADLAAGRDPVIEEATRWLHEKIQKPDQRK